MRRRQAFLDLEPLLGEDRRRMGEAAIFEARRTGEAMLAAIGAALIVLGQKFAGDVAGAHAQIEHYRRVARLGQIETFFDHVDDGRQIGPRVKQPDRGFHGVGIRTLLDDAGAFAKIFAEHDQRAADDTGRRQVRQRIGRHIGADDGFPRYRTAQRIIDRGAEHSRRRGLVGAGLDMHAEIGKQILGIHHDVEQMRHRRALVAAHIAHARLQQRLGDREDAFATKRLAVAEAERIYFLLKRAFHRVFPAEKFRPTYSRFCRTRHSKAEPTGPA